MTNEIERQRVSIKGIFRRDGKFLLLRQPDDFWELPGGGLELGESIGACFAREIAEELGWPGVQTGQVVHAWARTSRDGKIQYVLIAITAEASDKPIVLSAEHIESGWFSLPEIKTMKIRSASIIDAIQKVI